MPPNQRSVRPADIEDTEEGEVFPIEVVAGYLDDYQLVTFKVESGNYIGIPV